jgi:HD-GYP domain-containing protein (c-di-GMP phosphodiesterase class II)
MREHPRLALEMLRPIKFLEPSLDIPAYHHERWDGRGYPFGLRGEEIPHAARLFAVVDVFDALTSERPYRAAWPEQEALEYISAQAGSHFDPDVVRAFLDLMTQKKRGL